MNNNENDHTLYLLTAFQKKSVQSLVHGKTELKQITPAAITTTREFDIKRKKQLTKNTTINKKTVQIKHVETR